MRNHPHVHSLLLVLWDPQEVLSYTLGCHAQMPSAIVSLVQRNHRAAQRHSDEVGIRKEYYSVECRSVRHG